MLWLFIAALYAQPMSNILLHLTLQEVIGEPYWDFILGEWRVFAFQFDYLLLLQTHESVIVILTFFNERYLLFQIFLLNLPLSFLNLKVLQLILPKQILKVLLLVVILLPAFVLLKQAVRLGLLDLEILGFYFDLQGFCLESELFYKTWVQMVIIGLVDIEAVYVLYFRLLNFSLIFKIEIEGFISQICVFFVGQ